MEGEPDIAFRINLEVGYIPPKYLKLVTSFIEEKLKSGFMKDYGLPSWRRTELPWSTKLTTAEMKWANQISLGKASGLLQPSIVFKNSKAVTSTVNTNVTADTNNVNMSDILKGLSSPERGMFFRNNNGREVELQDMARGTARSNRV